jgi:hypothetical protein
MKILSCKMSLLIIVLNIAVEVPDVNSISLTHTYNLSIISRIENNGSDWISVSNKALEEVRNCLLSFIIPYFNHTIFTTSEHIS